VIDQANINDSAVMDEAEFRNIGALGNRGALINVVEVGDDGWAIFGPLGVFQATDGTRTFKDLAVVHGLLKNWGLARFIQGGQVKTF
jgi:hypothetical protein